MLDLLPEVAAFLGITPEELRLRHTTYLDRQLQRWSALHPRSTDTLKQFYDDDFYLYELVSGASRGLNYLVAPFVPPKATVLDYGSGIGTHGLHFLRQGCRVTFADIPSPHFRFIQWYTRRHRLEGASFVALGSPACSFPSARYDAIFCFDVLEHLMEWREVLARFASLLAENGRLFLVVSFRRFEGDALHINHLSGLTREALDSALAGHGLRRVFRRERPLSLTHPEEALEIFAKGRDPLLEQYWRAYDKTRRLAQAGRLAEARTVLRDLYASNPDDPGVLRDLGEYALQEGDFDEAKRFASRLLRLLPDDFRALEILGQAELASGDRASSLHHFCAALYSRPEQAWRARVELYGLLREGVAPAVLPQGDDWQEQMQLAGFLIDAGATIQAGELLARLAEQYPAASRIGLRVRKELARCLREREALGLALELLDSLVELWPAEPWLHFDRAIVLRDLGRLAEAWAELEAEMRLSPFLSCCYALRSSLWRQQGDFDRSLADASEAIKRMAERPDGFWERAITRKMLGRQQEALADLAQVITLVPWHFGAYLLAGMLLVDLGDVEGARKRAQEALRILPPLSVKARFQLAALLFRLGEERHAQALLAGPPPEGQPAGPYFFLQGRALLEAGRRFAAFCAFAKAVDADPPGVWSRLSWRVKAGVFALFVLRGRWTALAKLRGSSQPAEERSWEKRLLLRARQIEGNEDDEQPSER